MGPGVLNETGVTRLEMNKCQHTLTDTRGHLLRVAMTTGNGKHHQHICKFDTHHIRIGQGLHFRYWTAQKLWLWCQAQLLYSI